MGRFSILHHAVDGGSHWDILFENPRSDLWAWQVAANPLRQALQPVRRLCDHRRVYLNYRGPVLLNRGFVEPILLGRFELLCDDSQAFRARIWSQELHGLIAFEREGATDLWQCRMRSFDHRIFGDFLQSYRLVRRRRIVSGRQAAEG